MKLRALLQIPRRPRRSVRRNLVPGCAVRASRRSSPRLRRAARGPTGVRTTRAARGASQGAAARRSWKQVSSAQGGWQASCTCAGGAPGLRLSSEPAPHVAATRPNTRSTLARDASRRGADEVLGRAAAMCAAPSSVARNRFRATRGLLAAEGEDVLGDRKAQRDAADVALEVRRAVRAQREGVERPVHAQVDA